MIPCPQCAASLEHDDLLAGAGPFTETVSRMHWCPQCGWSWSVECRWIISQATTQEFIEPVVTPAHRAWEQEFIERRTGAA